MREFTPDLLPPGTVQAMIKPYQAAETVMMKEDPKMKKLTALILAIAMILTLAASAVAEEPAVKWQLVGVHTEEGEGANYTNGAFLVNLYEDGSVEVDRFLFLAGDNSDFASNTAYQAGFMVGTWEMTEKDGLEAVKVDVHCVGENGEELNPSTSYGYENFGELSFELSYPVIVGMSYSRTVELEGGEEIKYTDKNAFIADYFKAE